MFKLWICLALIASISSHGNADSDEQDDFYADYYLSDIDQEIFKPLSDILETTIPDLFVNPDNSKEVNDEMINYEDVWKLEDGLENYLQNNKNDLKTDDNLDDYQFEDQRSEIEGLSSEDENDDLIRPLSGMIFNDDTKEKNLDESIDLSKDFSKEDTDKMILEETKSILNEDTTNDFEKYKNFDEIKVNDDNSNIFDETSKILGEFYSNEKPEKDGNNSGEEIDSGFESLADYMRKLNNPEEDSAEIASKDLMPDLDKLNVTWINLNEPDENSDNFDSEVETKQVIESSEDYENIDDSDLDKIFKNVSVSEEENDKDKIDLPDKILFNNTPTVKAKIHKVLPYINDALVASDSERNIPISTVVSTEEVSSNKDLPLTKKASSQTLETNQKLNMDKMANIEEDNLIKTFIKEHKSIYDIKGSDVRNAINIRLTIDSPKEVTSTDYPLPYPTDNTVDWMLTGDGMGIELNITDFSINGHLGDYVLVKPGGVDESGSTGLIFTYNLRTERRYRFLDVDKMFVRFVANKGNQFMRGFKFSARMVGPRPNSLVEEEPNPEPLPKNPATITVNLGGITLRNFLLIEEQFRNIIADMATLYINTNGINPGINTTLESTQIVSRALCYHNWPKFEHCTEVKFGVPLMYDDEKNVTEARLNKTDLLDMWTFYSQRDPFAVRLRMMGITEYQVPDDASVVTMWLVVAGGVVVSAALLALALWRFSCFEDYTRMPIFNDTDSVTEKRTLDLYPTPHQTLPSLFTETDYKWADDNYDTDKVDMSFSNKSFLRDDSPEVLGRAPNRDRNFSFSPRDIYNV